MTSSEILPVQRFLILTFFHFITSVYLFLLLFMCTIPDVSLVNLFRVFRVYYLRIIYSCCYDYFGVRLNSLQCKSLEWTKNH